MSSINNIGLDLFVNKDNLKNNNLKIINIPKTDSSFNIYDIGLELLVNKDNMKKHNYTDISNNCVKTITIDYEDTKLDFNNFKEFLIEKINNLSVNDILCNYKDFYDNNLIALWLFYSRNSNTNPTYD